MNIMNPNLDYPKIGLLVFYVVNEKKILFSVSPPLQSGNFFFYEIEFWSLKFDGFKRLFLPSFSKISSNHGLYHNSFEIVNADLQFSNSGMIFGGLNPKKFKFFEVKC